ncbi:MAG: hypothetical protein ACT4PZ_20645 [Panacagrimonas sp.]
MADVRAQLRRLRGLGAAQAPAGRHESFLVYRRGCYLKLALLICVLSILAYALHDPVEGSSGSTWLGYTLGTLSAGLVVWLSWLGVRKRRFGESRAPMQAWVSAHVYLGLSLLVVATLHTGFQFGWNVHTLAYTLMVLVIASGIYGLFAYSVLPQRITAIRNQMEFGTMLEQVRELDESALALADRIDADTHALVVRSVSRAAVGGGAWEQLSGRYRRPGDAGVLDEFFELKRTELERKMQAMEPAVNAEGGAKGAITILEDQLFAGGIGQGREPLQKLLDTLARRNALLERVNRDITLRARLVVWLFVHVPMTIALIAALFVHVLAVFIYW